ncbi:DUF3265 domain-containing protein [Vibrio parahaemolyticus]|nr:DUF3265 domain-containing protein [Vibrio parahaemolyticus]OOH99127.1 hypothetical protein BIW15_23050 [Vibrio sp. SALL6]ELF4880276.1 DUF3265 domain-containing protein [Vibrio parahaemolyticus]TOE04017.1 DUF3265 domain-containing protein [Vibrio parahaemolyticus]TOH97513.1 DUF3265 domain-containing protein [Vibrio parahaemolyticus]
MTRRSRGTWHAWHFQFALGLVVKVRCGHFCIACLRPLTRRYVALLILVFISSCLWQMVCG